MERVSTLDMVIAKLADRPIGSDPEKIRAFLERELLPFVTEMRRKYNSFAEWPSVPVFATGPVTDLSFDSTGERVPPVGAVAIALSPARVWFRVSETAGVGAYLSVALE